MASEFRRRDRSTDGSPERTPRSERIDDELLDRILPQRRNGAVEAARQLIASDDRDLDDSATGRARQTILDNDGSGTQVTPASPLRPKSQTKNSSSRGIAHHSWKERTAATTSNPSAAANASATVTASASGLLAAEPDHSQDHIQSLPKKVLHRSDGTVAVPKRYSSRADGRDRGSSGNNSINGSNGSNAKRPEPREDAPSASWEQAPTLEEIEAARTILAQAMMARAQGPQPRPQQHQLQQQQLQSQLQLETAVSRTSATPPPIARPRRIICEDIDDDDDIDLPRYHENDDGYSQADEDWPDEESLITELRLPTQRPLSPSAGAASISSLPQQPRNPRAARRDTTMSSFSDRKPSHPRTPVLDHLRLYDDSELAPPLPAVPWAEQRPASSHGYVDVDRRAHEKKDAVDGGGANGHGHKHGRESLESWADNPVAAAGARPTSSDGLSSMRRSVSLRSKRSLGGRSAVTTGSSRMPEFFSRTIFQVVLHNPTTSHQFRRYSESRFCADNVEFLQKVYQYQNILNELATTMSNIHKEFISNKSSTQVNIPSAVGKKLQTGMKSLVYTSLPAMETLFKDSQDSIEELVFLDVYPRFVRHQMGLSAARALATDRFKYQGLGDCFCLTDPSQLDNPIVFASDGFVKVTGYTRTEIIPRNCRFLQGAHTDREPVRRLKTAINGRTESVELLLNYKKNGEPFWNLLYVAPLFDENGKLAFFIGGQVNCSTTIHSHTDVMRVLSMSPDQEEPELPQRPPSPPRRSSGPLPAARKALLKAFGVRVDGPRQAPTALADAGMERKVLGRMEGKGLNAQMKEFHTAYSKYIVLDNNFLIRFYSEGVTDMLHPANNVAGTIVGSDIFRFLKQNSMSSSSASPLMGHGFGGGNGRGGNGGGGGGGHLEFKGRVRNAIRLGSPVSIEVRLQTRRSALFRGDERFAAHWTPVKDVKGKVGWVVLTLGAMIA